MLPHWKENIVVLDKNILSLFAIQNSVFFFESVVLSDGFSTSVLKNETTNPNIRRQLAIRIATKIELVEFYISRSS